MKSGPNHPHPDILCSLRIHMAPMQGFTDYVYRRHYLEHFKGVDRTYSPFVMLRGDNLRGRDRRELVAGADEKSTFTPQIIAATKAEAERVTAIATASGLDRVNLNLGCPFTMLTKRKRGAGALPHPEQVAEILRGIFSVKSDLRVSVKTRLGLEDPREFDHILPVLNRFPLDEVIIHPRVGKQKYTGQPLWEELEEQGPKLNAPVVLNGDIETVEDARTLHQRFPFAKGIMLGRGLLRDPFLPARIKDGIRPRCEADTLRSFHDALYEAYALNCQSTAHLLDKMREFWSYFSDRFPDPHKAFKAIKKSRTRKWYEQRVDELFGTLA